MRECGTTSRPRVADIVAAAGLSNDAFYRHFRSKDALVAALVDDGALRLRSYLEHQMAKASTPERPGAHLGRGGDVAGGRRGGDHHPRSDLERRQRQQRFGTGTAGGKRRAGRSVGGAVRRARQRAPSSMPRSIAHAVFGRLAELLWQGAHADRAEVDHLVDFSLAAVSAPR